MKILTTAFSLGSLACEFQMVFILLSVGGSTLTFYLPELIEKLLNQGQKKIGQRRDFSKIF